MQDDAGPSSFSRALETAGAALVIGVLAVSPFFRGLFFWTELLLGIAVLALGFVLWVLGKRLGGSPLVLISGAGGLCLWILLASYVVQFGWAAYARGNLDWVLRVAAAILVYNLTTAACSRSAASSRTTGSSCGTQGSLAASLVLAAFVVAVIGIVAYSGYPMTGLPFLQLMPAGGDGVTSTFQYHNAASVFLLCGLLASVGLSLDQGHGGSSVVVTGLLGFASAVMGIGFFFGLSRGAFMVLPLVLVALIAGLDSEKRSFALSLLMTLAVAIALSLVSIGQAFKAKDAGGVLLWCCISGGVAALAWSGCAALRRRGGNVAHAVIIGTIAATLITGVLLSTSQVTPAQAKRLSNTYIGDSSVGSRIWLARDALRIFRGNPLGVGGSGWSRYYGRYQQTGYISNETHNHYAQTLVEAGVPGLLALVSAVVVSAIRALKHREGAALSWSLACAGMAIALHAAVDFDLSYGSLWLWLWALLGSASSGAATPRRAGDTEVDGDDYAGYVERDDQHDVAADGAAGPGSLGFAFSALLGLSVLALSTWLFFGSLYTDRALDMLDDANPAAAASLASRALRFDRTNSATHLAAGTLASVSEAVRLDPSNARMRFALAIQLELAGDLDAAVRETRKAMSLKPFTADYYSKLVTLLGVQMVSVLHDGKEAEALQLANDILDSCTKLRDGLNSGTPGAKYTVSSLPLNPLAKLRVGQAYSLKADDATALPLLRNAARVGLLNSEAEVWLYATYEKQRNTALMKSLETKPWIRFRAQNPIYMYLKSRSAANK